jgi:hypothetical protein
VVEQPHGAAGRDRARTAPGPEEPLVRSVHDDHGPAGADAARVEHLARLVGHGHHRVGDGGAHGLLGAQHAQGPMPRGVAEAGREELGERVVHVEDHRRPAQLGQQRCPDQEVGHVVGLDDVEAPTRVERRDLAQRTQEEAGIAAQVGERARRGLLASGRVQPDAPRTHA